MVYRRAKRSILWIIIYYGVSLFAIFYLKEIEIINNWNVIWVFLPLLVLTFSSETIAVKRLQDGRKILTPYSYIDFASKFLAYICSQLIYRHIAVGVFFCLV